MTANICRWLNFQNIQTAHTIQYQKTPNNPIKKWAEDSHFSEEVTQMVNQVRSVAQLSPTLCDPVNCSMPGLPVHHRLPEFTQTHVHQVGDTIQPSHPLSSPSPPAPNPSQHQSLFQ